MAHNLYRHHRHQSDEDREGIRENYYMENLDNLNQEHREEDRSQYMKDHIPALLVPPAFDNREGLVEENKK